MFSLKTQFFFGGNAFQNAFHSISGIEEMRNKILLCGMAGILAILKLTKQEPLTRFLFLYVKSKLPFGSLVLLFLGEEEHLQHSVTLDHRNPVAR
jgi:hypothetical protein